MPDKAMLTTTLLMLRTSPQSAALSILTINMLKRASGVIVMDETW